MQYPITTIEVPWSWRSTLSFYSVAAYTGYSRNDYGAGWSYMEYFVPLGDKDSSFEAMLVAMPGYDNAVRPIVDTKGKWPPRRAHSRFSPWVMPSNHDGFANSRWNTLGEHLRRCKLANVGPDAVFNGRDLVLHVQAYAVDTRRVGPVAGLGLVGIEVYDPPLDWTPIPDFKRANNKESP